jgi:endogenous inhibitor of DNA gyrase (YacG/DUF329 family)
MTSIKVEESTVKCANCEKVHNAEDCLQELDIIAWGYTSHENLACPDCGGNVELENAERLHG